MGRLLNELFVNNASCSYKKRSTLGHTSRKILCLYVRRPYIMVLTSCISGWFSTDIFVYVTIDNTRRHNQLVGAKYRTPTTTPLRKFVSNVENITIWRRHVAMPWVCYERSFNEFYLSIRSQLIFYQRLQLFVQSPHPYLLIFAWRN